MVVSAPQLGNQRQVSGSHFNSFIGSSWPEFASQSPVNFSTFTFFLAADNRRSDHAAHSHHSQ
jgi:hypothetical protein